MGFKLSASLNTDRIRNDFEQLGYVHVSDVLPKENAQRLRKSMLEDTRWSLVFNDRERHVDMPPEQYSMLSPEKIRELHHAIYAQAQQGFQYCYNNYPIFDVHHYRCTSQESSRKSQALQKTIAMAPDSRRHS